ncbi:MAG: hypothetical protein LBQ42_04265 [Synergistaceae bacterium]|jgi:hypothetical protein|nr:hypothetical protein [Synergistaceae bacterium]
MRPRLIHPRGVILHRRIATEADPDLGPTGHIEWEAPAALSGQVKYNKYNQMTPVGSGNDPVADGHIVFYEADWKRLNGKPGDEMELSPDTRLVVTEVRPAAHYAGRNWHVHVLFVRKRVSSK